jgi:glycosyltransferase involved in cell wall biosynthesis
MITFILLNTKLGGAEQLMMRLADYYLKQNSSVTVIFVSKDLKSPWDQYIKNGNVKLYFSGNSILKFITILRSLSSDVTFSTHVYLTGILGFLRGLGILKTQFLIGRESTSIFDRFKGLKLLSYRFSYFIGYRKLDLLICQSSLMKKQFKMNLPNISKNLNIRVIPNAFDAPDRFIQEREFDFPFIVSAGRLIPEKGFDILIEAFHRINKEYPSLKLLILGDGILRKQLEGQVSRLGMEDSIHLLGFVDNVYPFFKEASLCVVSSRIEGFPNVLLQMMSQNTKVVSTLCAGDINEIRGVYKAATYNVESLKTAILEALSKENRGNRKFFDEELKSRSIDKFVQQIQ